MADKSLKVIGVLKEVKQTHYNKDKGTTYRYFVVEIDDKDVEFSTSNTAASPDRCEKLGEIEDGTEVQILYFPNASGACYALKIIPTKREQESFEEAPEQTEKQDRIACSADDKFYAQVAFKGAIEIECTILESKRGQPEGESGQPSNSRIRYNTKEYFHIIREVLSGKEQEPTKDKREPEPPDEGLPF